MPAKARTRSLRTVTYSSGTSVEKKNMKKDTARRCLFGKVVKKEDDTWLADTLEKLDENRGQNFNFDFKNDKPIEDGKAEFKVEAVDEKEVPMFYRTKVYLPGERRRRIAPPKLTGIGLEGEEESGDEDTDAQDYVAKNTRSHDKTRNSLSTCMASTSTRSPSIAGEGRKRTISEPASVVVPSTKPITVQPKKHNTEPGASGLRKRPMKQPTITSYMPVVCKRGVVSCKVQLRGDMKHSDYLVVTGPKGSSLKPAGISKSIHSGVKGAPRRGPPKVASVPLGMRPKRIRSNM